MVDPRTREPRRTARYAFESPLAALRIRTTGVSACCTTISVNAETRTACFTIEYIGSRRPGADGWPLRCGPTRACVSSIFTA